jgi:hypothetical protein
MPIKKLMLHRSKLSPPFNLTNIGRIRIQAGSVISGNVSQDPDPDLCQNPTDLEH